MICMIKDIKKVRCSQLDALARLAEVWINYARMHPCSTLRVEYCPCEPSFGRCRI